jgi:hypothetical protein
MYSLKILLVMSTLWFCSQLPPSPHLAKNQATALRAKWRQFVNSLPSSELLILWIQNLKGFVSYPIATTHQVLQRFSRLSSSAGELIATHVL